MIGRPEWFKRRKYGGWGISPKTWQGWVYVALTLIPFIVFQALPYWNTQTRLYVTIGWIIFLLIDVSHIMFNLNRDEREYKIEAISERNAGWAMMFVILVGLLYQIFSTALANNLKIDPFLAIALFAGAFVKTISNIILERRKI